MEWQTAQPSAVVDRHKHRCPAEASPTNAPKVADWRTAHTHTHTHVPLMDPRTVCLSHDMILSTNHAPVSWRPYSRKFLRLTERGGPEKDGPKIYHYGRCMEIDGPNVKASFSHAHSLLVVMRSDNGRPLLRDEYKLFGFQSPKCAPIWMKSGRNNVAAQDRLVGSVWLRSVHGRLQAKTTSFSL